MNKIKYLWVSYSHRPLININANIIIASLIGAAGATIASPHLMPTSDLPLQAAMRVSGINAALFLAVQCSLQYAVAYTSYSDTAESSLLDQYFFLQKRIYITGIFAISTYLLFFAGLNWAFLALGTSQRLSGIISYLGAQIAARIIHIMALRAKTRLNVKGDYIA